MKYLPRLVASALLLFASLAAHSQTFDLAAGLQVSKTAQLKLGDEILVAVTVSNAGPDMASNVSVSAGPAQEDGYLYVLVGSDAGSTCGAPEEIETDPPQWAVYWTPPAIPAGGSVTCIARLRVAVVPATHVGTMHAGAYSNRDPKLGDNFVQVGLGFSSPSGAYRVPTSSWWAVVVAVMGVFVSMRIARRA